MDIESIDYSLENLISIFKKHANQSDKNQQEIIRYYKENFPDSELPEYMKDNFNISYALSVMCCEIEKLKTLL